MGDFLTYSPYKTYNTQKKKGGKVMKKPLIVSLPYPSLDDIEKDKKTALILSRAYAGCHGELNAILQYIYHHFYFNDLRKKEYAEKLIEISLAEMLHLSLLGETLLKLGLDPQYITYSPLFNNFYSTKNVSYSKQIDKMLLDDLSSELVAIEEYKEISQSIKDPKIQALLSRIILDEELHVQVLKEIMEKDF